MSEAFLSAVIVSEAFLSAVIVSEAFLSAVIISDDRIGGSPEEDFFGCDFDDLVRPNCLYMSFSIRIDRPSRTDNIDTRAI